MPIMQDIHVAASNHDRMGGLGPAPRPDSPATSIITSADSPPAAAQPADRCLITSWELPSYVSGLSFRSLRQLHHIIRVRFAEAYAAVCGITRLHEWQAECLATPGVLPCKSSYAVEASDVARHRAKSLVYSAPTSGGKSLVAELIMIHRLLYAPPPASSTASTAARGNHTHKRPRGKQQPAFDLSLTRALVVLPYV